MLAAQKNITIVMPSGMTVQSSSSECEPVIPAPTSVSWRRRYFTAKTTTSSAIRMVKNALTATRKKYSASTCPAYVEAAVGKNLLSILVDPVCATALAAQHEPDESGHRENGQHPAHAARVE